MQFFIYRTCVGKLYNMFAGLFILINHAVCSLLMSTYFLDAYLPPLSFV